jgi:hypothetical protein
MARKKEISDEDAADALHNGSKSGSVPTHSAMQSAEDDADAADAAQDDDWDPEDRQGY